MKRVILFLICSIIASQAQTNTVTSVARIKPKPLILTSTNQYEKVTMKDGVTYEIVRWDKKDPDGITIIYSVHGAFGGNFPKKIPFELLPDDLCKKFGFNAQYANTYREYMADKEKEDAERIKEYQKLRLEQQRVEIQKQQADAMVEQAIQQRRTAEAMLAQAKAAEIANQIASNKPPAQINNNTYQNNTSVIQQQQQNNYGW